MAKLSGEAVGGLFARGAMDGFSALGVPKSVAAHASSAMGKSAARMYHDEYDDEEDDRESLLDKSKKWLIPTIVGLGAFMLGDHFGKHGRRDRNAFQNVKDVLYRRIRKGGNIGFDSPLRAFSTADLPIKNKSSIGLGGEG